MIMKNHLLPSLLSILMLVTSFQLTAQVGINASGSQPDASAGLDVSFNNKGFLMPRMTTPQRNAIQTPAEGLLIFNLTTGCIDYYLGSSWKSFCGASEPAFQCGMKIADTRDGKMYHTVKIGTQCWMAENLKTGAMINGLQEQTNNATIEKYCYNDLESNCSIYGGLYQWNEMMQYVNTPGVQGICPTGWHIPTDLEWTTLTAFLGGKTVAGGKVKSTGTIEAGTGLWLSPNTGATNESGFTAVPGGYRDPDGSFSLIGSHGIWWSSFKDEENVDYAWRRGVTYNLNVLFQGSYPKNSGYSVRCLRDL
jgi:uncharacterized protein (TIGR02145 family)